MRLTFLFERFNPLVLCLQETYLKDVTMSFFRKYSFYNKIDSVTKNKLSGGVTITMNKSMHHSEIIFNPLAAEFLYPSEARR